MMKKEIRNKDKEVGKKMKTGVFAPKSEKISVKEFMKRSFEDKSTYDALKRLSEK